MIKSRPNFALIAPGGGGGGGFYRTARQSCDNVLCGSFHVCSVVTSVNHTSTRSKGTPASLVVVASMESINQTCV